MRNHWANKHYKQLLNSRPYTTNYINQNIDLKLLCISLFLKDLSELFELFDVSGERIWAKWIGSTRIQYARHLNKSPGFDLCKCVFWHFSSISGQTCAGTAWFPFFNGGAWLTAWILCAHLTALSGGKSKGKAHSISTHPSKVAVQLEPLYPTPSFVNFRVCSNNPPPLVPVTWS